MAAGIFGKAFVTAYQQAVMQAKNGPQAAEAAAKAAGIAKNAMTRGQARQVLNLEKEECNPKNLQKQVREMERGDSRRTNGRMHY